MRAALAILSLAVAAQTVHAEDKAAAEAAFVRAKALEKAGKSAEACPLYEVSYRADPQLGALLNVANCHEAIGRTGTAWAEFREAYELATRKGDARGAYALRRAEALAPKLVRLRVDAVPSPGLTVTRDGTDMTSALGLELVVDPGEHEVVARAPGRTTWKRSVKLRADEQVVRVQIPALAEPAPEPAAVPTDKEPTTSTATLHAADLDAKPASVRVPDEEPAPATGPRTRRWALWVAGVGGGAVAVGLGFGLRARGEWNASREECDTSNVCSPAGAAHVRTARSSAQIATFAVGGGAALAVTAAVLYWTSPRTAATEKRLSAAPLVGPDAVGAMVFARF